MWKKVIILILVLMAIATFGILISWQFAENICSNIISKDAWMQFFGSYLGAVMGSIVTIITVIFTLQYEREIQNREFKKRDDDFARSIKENAKMMVMPAFSLKRVNMASEICEYSHSYNMASDRKDLDGQEAGEYGANLILSNIAKSDKISKM